MLLEPEGRAPARLILSTNLLGTTKEIAQDGCHWPVPPGSGVGSIHPPIPKSGGTGDGLTGGVARVDGEIVAGAGSALIGGEEQDCRRRVVHGPAVVPRCRPPTPLTGPGERLPVATRAKRQRQAPISSRTCLMKVSGSTGLSTNISGLTSPLSRSSSRVLRSDSRRLS